jgi:chromosome segregation ATPase
LQTQVSERRNNKEQLEQELVTLQELHQQLEVETGNLQARIQEFQAEHEQWNQALSQTKEESQKTEAHLQSLQAELSQLQAQVTEQRSNKEALEQELSQLEEYRRQLEETLSNSPTETETQEAPIIGDEELPPEWADFFAQLPKDAIPEEDLPPEWANLAVQKPEQEMSEEELAIKWSEFMDELSKDDIQLLKAIAEQDNPVGTLGSLAEKNRSTPEQLIHSINERALETLGSKIIDPASNPPVITSEDSLSILNQLLTVYAYLEQ